ncbi:nuclear transport factor 2 family protein [Gordonia rubripertincta]|uniref:Nuclear transport factor 2 family protein n=1 Tax=Gordonia rubripertincta TaxID=36822 RepID=A0ABT4MVM7_GORRU|nr:nuclear transport factor 2 family protein [Gordonia rubripertincta]MCZ4551046.1 nuclear transport factor 2 family protein [Gordonia rubripertincta]
MGPDAELRRVLDEAAIGRVIAQNFRAADRCDLEMLKASYWPDASYWHIFSSGNAWDSMEKLVVMLSETTESGTHNLGSMVIEINEDVAACESNSTNFLRVKSPDGPVSVMITARILDRFERRNGEWRIATRRILPAWQMNAAAMMGEEAVELHFSGGRQGLEDPSYAFLAELGQHAR